MSIFSRFWYGDLESLDPKPSKQFSQAVGSDYATWNSLVAGDYSSYVTRESALAVPAVKAGVDLIANTLSGLPIHQFNQAGEKVANSLLDWPESREGYTRSVTISRTVRDLILEGAALWLVTGRAYTGYPTSVAYIEWGKWNQDDDGVIRVNGDEVESGDCILFHSPTDALLRVGAKTISALIRLEQSASLYLNSPEASHYFKFGSDYETEEVAQNLEDWETARRQRATGAIPEDWELHDLSRMTPEQMVLQGARDFMVTEVARLLNIPPGFLAIAVSSRTYSNIRDEKRSLIDYCFKPFIDSIEQRLSLGDVTPNGNYVKLSLDGFLRGDPSERAGFYSAMVAAGIMTVDECRALEDLAQLNTPKENNDPEIQS